MCWLIYESDREQEQIRKSEPHTTSDEYLLSLSMADFVPLFGKNALLI